MDEIEKLWDQRARFYDLQVFPMELMGMKRLRRSAIRHVRGPEVLEVGMGTGKNLSLYPPGLHITGIDVSPKMLEKARLYAGKIRSLLHLHVMDAQSLAFPDNSFDTVLATCVFCSVPDPVKGLREIRRVCKPDSRVVLLEHMRPERIPWLGRLFDRLDPIMARKSGFHIARRTMDNIRAAGLKVDSVECRLSDIVRLILASPGK